MQGTLDDLTLFIGLNVAILTALAVARAAISEDPIFWDSVYGSVFLPRICRLGSACTSSTTFMASSA